MRRLALGIVLVIGWAVSAWAQTVPSGFVAEQVVGAPFDGDVVAFAFLPDGRILLAERSTGGVRVAGVGSSTSTPVLTIPGVVADFGERGLLGIAVDPDWPKRPFVYFYYTHTAFCRVTMYEASGDLEDPHSDALSFSNPFHLLTDISDANEIHNAGTLRFGPDGMLYVSVGDDAFSCQPQLLTSLLGKILRLDVSMMPQGGSGPPPKSDLTPVDNPFPGPNENARLVYAWGLRNPFRFTIDSGSGDVFIGSVGSAHYEEINLAVRSGYEGNNYGWPQHEGPQEIHCCGDCGEGNLFTEPIHVLAHNGPPMAIIGGPRVREVPGSPFGLPASYWGDYFYVELYSGKLYRLRDTAGNWDHAPAAPGQPDPVAWGIGFYYAADVQQGPDGALYFASLGVNAALPRGIHRVRQGDPTGVVVTPGSESGALRVMPNPSRGDVRFSVPSARRERVRVEVVDATGRRVRTLLGSGGGGDTIVWDGRNDDGAPVAPGVYAVRWSGATGVWQGRAILR